MDWIGDSMSAGQLRDKAFERWLRQDLAAGHDAALREPLPAEWLRLLERAPEAQAETEGAGS